MISLKSILYNYHSINSSVSELLPWFEQLTSDLIINQDGSLLAGYEIEGLDKYSSSQIDFDRATQLFNNALKILNEKNTIWIYLDKKKIEIKIESNITNPISNFIEIEWSKDLSKRKLFSYKHFIFISFFPEVNESQSIEKWIQLFQNIFLKLRNLSFKLKNEDTKQIIEKSIIEFEIQLDSYERILQNLKIKRLSKNNLLTQLSNRINLASFRSKVPSSLVNQFSLNEFLSMDSIQRVENGVIKFIGALENKYVSMLTIKGYPGQVENTDIEKLLNINAEFSIIHVYKFLSNENSKNTLMKKEQYYRSRVKSPFVQMFEKVSGVESTRSDLGQLSFANDSRQALISISETENKFGYHTMSILLVAESLDELDKTRKLVSEVLINIGFGVIKEVLHQIGAFMTSIPGAVDVMVRSTLIGISNLAHLVLLRSVKSESKFNQHLSEQRRITSPFLCMFPTSSGVPEYFNFHVGDVGHFLLIGQSGGGKSTLVNFLISMWQKYYPCKTIILDKDKSCYLTVKALGGEYINLSTNQNENYRMNPLQWLKDPEKFPLISSWIIGLLTTFNNDEISPYKVDRLNHALKLLTSSLSNNLTLSHLKLMLDGIDEDLSSRLSPWVRDDQSEFGFGYLFDNPIDTFFQNLSSQGTSIICIDFSSILVNEKIARPIIEYLLLCVDNYIDGKSPSLIYLEEAWYLLKDKRFSDQFENWIKTMRKKMAIIGLSTQSVDDIKKLSISAAINDNIKTKIFLPNLQVDASYSTYKDFLGLRDDHIQSLKNLTPKSQYLIWQDERVRVIDAKLPFRVLALTRSDSYAIGLFDQLFHKNGLEAYMSKLEKLQ
jgi:type IV secretion system protein VirB4